MTVATIEVGVDELTLVLHRQCGHGRWPDVGRSLAADVADALGLEGLGPRVRSGATLLTRYPVRWDYGPAQLGIHELRPDMGVCLHLGGRALARWCDASGDTAAGVVARLTELDADVRTTRIDVVADYLDGAGSCPPVSALAGGLVSGDLGVWRTQAGRGGARQVRRAYQSAPQVISSGGEDQTLYLGYRGKSVRSVLRVYDKRAEQVNRRGPQLARAQACDSWVRMEASYRGPAAHALGARIADVGDAGELSALLRGAMLSRWAWRLGRPDGGPGELAPWSAALADGAAVVSLFTGSHGARDVTLARRVENLCRRSGLVTACGMARVAWGDEGVDELFVLLRAYVDADDAPPAPVVTAWARDGAAAAVRDGTLIAHVAAAAPSLREVAEAVVEAA